MMSYPKIVLDATNATSSGRSEYIALGETNQFATCIVHVLNPGNERNKLRPNPVPTIAYSTYWSRYEEPSLSARSCSSI